MVNERGGHEQILRSIGKATFHSIDQNIDLFQPFDRSSLIDIFYRPIDLFRSQGFDLSNE
jgi:hypothetical protein